MGFPRCMVALVLVLASGCGGDGPAAVPRSPGPAPAQPAAGTEPPGFPVVRMQAGTDFVKGVARLACVGDRCERDPGARPSRTLTLAGRGLLTFITGRRFGSARLEVVRRGSVVEKASLRPGTTMAYVADLRAGRYELSLTGRWPEGRGRWVFGLKVPQELT